MNEICAVQFAGQEFILHASGALFWPKYKIMVVSDLHLEKGSYLAKFASSLPLYDSVETINKINYCIDYFSPEIVISLGDSFHDVKALDRMSREVFLSLEKLIARAQRWYWILGNHDPVFSQTIPGEQLHSFTKENIHFLHMPEGKNFEICGHFHPIAKVPINRNFIKGPVFAANNNLLIMPAMGTFTGGLDVKSQVIRNLMGDNFLLYFIYNNKIYPMNF